MFVSSEVSNYQNLIILLHRAKHATTRMLCKFDQNPVITFKVIHKIVFMQKLLYPFLIILKPCTDIHIICMLCEFHQIPSITSKVISILASTQKVFCSILIIFMHRTDIHIVCMPCKFHHNASINSKVIA